MSDISLDLIKVLREETGAGMIDVRNALTEAGGDKSKAIEILRKKGLSARAKKAERQTGQGLVHAYIHAGGRVGVLIEVNCETDFVARTDDFKALVADLAMHVAAAAPLYVREGDVPPEVLEKEKEIAAEQSKSAGKPAEVVAKIVEGRVAKYYEEVVLLNQKFIKNPDETVNDYVAGSIAKLGENIQIRRFTRYVLGGE